MVKLPQARKIVRKKKFQRLTKEVKSKSIRRNRDPMLRSVRIATLDNDAILENGKRKFSHQHTLKDGNMTTHQDTQKVPDAQKSPFCNNTSNCVPLMSDYKKDSRRILLDTHWCRRTSYISSGMQQLKLKEQRNITTFITLLHISTVTRNCCWCTFT